MYNANDSAMQRKFVNKHRQKRKYTHKTEEISSFSFSKTAYGMVPLMVMLITFMLTIVISTPFRDALSNTRFNFQFLQFSFDNPVVFIQSIVVNIVQASIFTWTVILVICRAFMQSISTFSNSAERTLIIVQNNIAIQKEVSLNFIKLFGQETTKTFTIVEQIFSGVRYYLIFSIQTVATVILTTIRYIEQFIIFVAISITKTITLIFFYVFHLLLIVALTVSNFSSFIGEMIWSILVSIGNVISTTTQHILNAVVNLIELPFKVIYVFLLQIKPYIDVFAKHIQMTGNDFSNGFTSIGKVASLMDASK